MELESRHGAKAVVRKQRAPSEDGKGDFSSIAGPKARGPRPLSR